MKRLIVIVFLIGQSVYGQNVNIPDSIFKSYVLNKCDTSSDGNVQLGEANLMDSLVIESMGISDLTGIETFTNLFWIQCGGNNISSINTTNNIALEFLHCNGNQLTSIDVSDNPTLSYLECRNNQLIELDFRNGNNSEMYLDTRDNSNLTCISVDDVSIANSSIYYYRDSVTNYNIDCTVGIKENIDYSSSFHIQNNLLSSDIDGHISIYDITGKLILISESPTSFYIKNGLHLIQIETKENIITHKVFIK